MKNPNIKTKVVHSTSEAAWKIINEKLGGKHKIATVPYVAVKDEEVTEANRNEAKEHAEFISHCFNNSDAICVSSVEELRKAKIGAIRDFKKFCKDNYGIAISHRIIDEFERGL